MALRAGAIGIALVSLAIVGYEFGIDSESAPHSDAEGEAEPSTLALGRTFASRPDLRAPLIQTVTHAPDPRRSGDDDLIFLAPKDGEPLTGPLIVDPDGEPVWIKPLLYTRAYDLRVQEYAGEPVLTWWEGANLGVGYGFGDYHIMDTSYREIATVTTRAVIRFVSSASRSPRDSSPTAGPASLSNRVNVPSACRCASCCQANDE